MLTDTSPDGVTCPHCQAHFPKSDTINSRHKAACPGWVAQLGERKPLACLCGHEETSLTQMKRHRQGCEMWKARDRGEVQMGRLAVTLGARFGVSRPHQLRVLVPRQLRPRADPTEVHARRRATNLLRYGVEEVLSAPTIRERITQTNQARYGGPAPGCSPEIIEKARQTNLERWGVEWTGQHPEIRGRQLDSMIERYGSHFFASDEGRAKIRAVIVEKYGVDHPAKIDGFCEKAVETFVRKYGAEHPLMLTDFLEKRRETCRERFGVDNPMQDPSVYRKAMETYRVTCHSRYGVENAMQVPEIALKALVNAGGKGEPNLLERRFGTANPELLYTGNGAFWRWLPKIKHHKNPDFILPGPDAAQPKKGVTKVVEVFGDFWHSRMFTGRANFEHEAELVDAYLDVGIACLVVWEDDFKTDPAGIRARVVDFLAQPV